MCSDFEENIDPVVVDAHPEHPILAPASAPTKPSRELTKPQQQEPPKPPSHEQEQGGLVAKQLPQDTTLHHPLDGSGEIPEPEECQVNHAVVSTEIENFFLGMWGIDFTSHSPCPPSHL